jgi:hypothetical protein
MCVAISPQTMETAADSNNIPPFEHLTVGQLRTALAGVPDEVVVALVLPPGTRTDARLTLFFNLKTDYAGGPVFRLRPLESDEGSR